MHVGIYFIREVDRQVEWMNEMIIALLFYASSDHFGVSMFPCACSACAAKSGLIEV